MYHEFEKSNAKVIQLKKKMSLQVFVTAKSTASILIDPTCEQRSEF